MKIIKVESCEDCPYKLIGYSHKDGSWKVKCTLLGKSEHKILSTSKYDKDKLDYTIPVECPLDDVKIKERRVEVKCDFCDLTDSGTKHQLIDRGWNKIFFDDIELPSITSCWKHRSQAVKKAEDLQRRQ